MKEDPNATKQRWYCKCGARYKSTWGVLIEIVREDVASYCLAEIPPQHLQDAKGMIIEQKYLKVKNAKELYDAIHICTPIAKSCFQQLMGIDGQPVEGHWKVLDAELLHALPKFEWAQLYNLPSVAEAAAATAEAQGKKKKKSYQYPPPATEFPASSSASAVAEELASMNIRDL